MPFERLNIHRRQRTPVMSPDLVSLLHDKCNGSAIKQLLRKAKDASGNGDVKISARNKEELISENLRIAVANRHVPLAKVHNLLMDSEENGRQIMLFYEPKEEIIESISDPESVAEVLFGDDWKSECRFPLFKEKPRGEVWADFRLDSSSGAWVAKLYRGDDRWVFKSELSRETANRRTKVWERDYSRDVFLYKWHPEKGLLEIRTPRVDGMRELYEVVGIAWGGLRNLCSKDDFKKYGLTSAASYIVHDRTGLDGEVALGPARLLSEQGAGDSTSFAMGSSDQYLHDSEAHTNAMEFYELCQELVIYWHRQSEDDEDQTRLKCVVGYKGLINGILIPARIGKVNVDYVAGRLLEIESEQRN